MFVTSASVLAQDAYAKDASIAKTEQIELSVFPNPAVDFFSILNDQDVAKIGVYSVVGKLMKTLDHSPTQRHRIDAFRKGLYIIRLYNDDKEIIKVLRLNKK